jgi:very-short-patch-repair endonuclease
METKLCGCGCGHRVKMDTSKYLSGHSSRDPKIQEQKRLKCLEKYGVEHPSKLIAIKEKTKQTCISRYGAITNLISNEHKEKNKQIIIDKYGVDNPFKSDQIKKKIKETNIILYGVENPAMSKEIQMQKKQNSILKYGVESPNQLNHVKEKKKNAYLKKYGVDSPSKSNIIWSKYRRTCTLRYGVDHWNKTNQAKQMCRENFIRLIQDQKSNNEPTAPRIGTTERTCLNELQKHTEFNIIRNSTEIGYSIFKFPDGYINELNLIIEYDESHHEEKNQKIKDVNRELYISSALGCIIFRIKEKVWKKDPEAIINQFKLLLDLLKTEPN